MFAFAQNFEQLAWARFLLGFIGAGFVVGVRIIGDWFPSSQIGTAEGVYAGWGNFGAAFAAISLPSLAFLFDDQEGWRYAIALTGLIALLFAWVYYQNVENFPPELTGEQSKQASTMEVSSISDLFLYMLSLIPLYASLAILIWKLHTPEFAVLDLINTCFLQGLVTLTFLLHAYQLVKTNSVRLSRPVASIYQYRYSQVFILAITYLITFGSKLAVLSMLPLFLFNTFAETQQLSMQNAGLLASSFVITNIIARPLGGLLSDRIGRRLALFLFSTGLTAGYSLMAFIASDWSLWLTVFIILFCSVFMQAAEGAIFAFVPLIRRPITGEVAGIVGAYGNAGAIIFLILYSVVSPSQFFILLACCCLSLLLLTVWLEEPRTFINEIQPDGTVIRIELES
jgi:NNP family nitrate/nitrite transporter-like MFS transporter